MSKVLDEPLLIDGLEYCKWNRDLLKNAHRGGLNAIHVTVVYWAVSYTHLTLPTICSV